MYFTLIRGKDGSKKIGGFGIGRGRQWVGPATHEDSVMISDLAKIKEESDLEMKLNFGTKEMIQNGTSTYIGSRGY